MLFADGTFILDGHIRPLGTHSGDLGSERLPNVSRETFGRHSMQTTIMDWYHTTNASILLLVIISDQLNRIIIQILRFGGPWDNWTSPEWLPGDIRGNARNSVGRQTMLGSGSWYMWIAKRRWLLFFQRLWRLGGDPPLARGVLQPPTSELREPIWIIFGFP